MVKPITKPWFVIHQPGILKITHFTPSELQTMENVWLQKGKTVVFIDAAQLILVGKLDWIEELISTENFNDSDKL